MSSKYNFGEFLRTVREKRMMTQKELAEKADITPSHLNKIEKGSRMPSDNVLWRLADVLVEEELFTVAGRLVPEEFKVKHKLSGKTTFEEAKAKIKKMANCDLVQFLMDFCELEENDAQLIADIIKLRKKEYRRKEKCLK